MASGPDPSLPLAAQIIFLIILILINAFFTAAETAIVSVNKNKIKQLAIDGNEKAKLLLRLLEEPHRFLSTTEVFVTSSTFIVGAIGAAELSGTLNNRFIALGLSAFQAHYLSIAVFVVLLVVINLLFGILYPKRIALQHSEGMALTLAKPITFITIAASPIVLILSKMVHLALIITRQKTAIEDEEFSEDEVMSMLEVGQETGVLKEEGKKMINSIFAFDDKLAYEVMTPRTDVFYIDINSSAEDYMDDLMEMRYSRIPVCEDDRDNIIGIVHIKDFLIKARENGFEDVDLRSILRKPYFVPETKNIDSLFFDLQSSKQHIAILIDEYGGFSGIVTMEDIIEEVMGDIDDEYDEEELPIEKIDDNTFIVDGLINLDDLDEELNLNLQSENSETLGGLIIDILGEIPDEDEPEERIIEYENCIFKIESVKERRIEKVKIYIIPTQKEVSDENTENLKEN
ncbi:hemolysin family protein [Clostridium aminobutyricum]|uniref:HlyC/CorC family transporter n=1 Tax=Clostridium aminobutyricum TaxID=33953 RepID=A0A939IIG2_CLOAM|nr:hemolysin family protein [Clostridium aminobutyricum]MBN7772454.1 HlyC/CorC family transporter [Clostridium aminobutyricum]